jgi:hypothetical protein
MPPLPKAFPPGSSDPAFQCVNIPAIFGQVAVSPPSLPQGAPAVSELVTALAAPPLFPNLLLESFHPLGGHFDLPFPVDAKSQELPFPPTPHPALGRVDFQPQGLLDPLGEARQPSFRGPTAAPVNLAVVRLPAERQSALFQFPVPRVQIEVGQPRRERPPLRRACLGCLHHPFDPHPTAPVSSNKPQHPFVPNRLTDPRPQEVVVHAVQETYDTLPTSKTSRPKFG